MTNVNKFYPNLVFPDKFSKRRDFIVTMATKIGAIISNNSLSLKHKQMSLETFLESHLTGQFNINSKIIGSFEQQITNLFSKFMLSFESLAPGKIMEEFYGEKQTLRINSKEKEILETISKVLEVLPPEKSAYLFYTSLRNVFVKSVKPLQKEEESQTVQSLDHVIIPFKDGYKSFKKNVFLQSLVSEFLTSMSNEGINIEKLEDENVKHVLLTAFLQILSSSEGEFNIFTTESNRGLVSNSFFMVKKTFFEQFLPYHDADIILPMIKTPKNWEFDSDKGLPVKGGFLTKPFSGYSKMCSNQTVFFSETTIKSMNFLQRVPHIICKTQLSLLRDNFYLGLTTSLYERKKPIDKKLVKQLLIRKGEKIILDTKANFISGDPVLKSLKQAILSQARDQFKLSDDETLNFLINCFFLPKSEKKGLDEPILSIIKHKNIREYCLRLQELKNSYNNVLNGVFFYFTTLIFSEMLTGLNLFFPTFLDSRGRLYYYGSLFNPQGSKLIRSILMLKDSSNLNMRLEDTPTIKAIKSGKENKFLEILLEKLQESGGAYTTAHLDVVSSGMQIVSALAGIFEGMTATKFIQSYEDQKMDLYERVLFEMKNSFQNLSFEKCPNQKIMDNSHYILHFLTNTFPLNSLTESQCSQKSFNILLSKYGVNNKELTDTSKILEKCHKNNITFLVVYCLMTIHLNKCSRKQIKFHIMPFIYRQGTYSRSKNIKAEIFKIIKEYYPDLKTALSSFLEPNELSRLTDIAASFTSTLFLSEMNKLYPNLVNFSDHISLLAKEKAIAFEPLVIKFEIKKFNYKIDLTYGHNVEISELKKVKVFTNLKDSKKVFQKQISFSKRIVNLKKLDSVKMELTSVANVVQSIDAAILHCTIKILEQKKVKSVSTAHDCFYTSSLYSNVIKDAYYEAFMEILFNSKIMEQFIENNCKNSNSIEVKLLGTNELEKICAENARLKKHMKGFKMSPDILGP
jgi:hypothetical protein